MEQFIGCDAHKKFSVFVAVNEKGQAGEALRVAHDRQLYREFLARLPVHSAIAVEASGSYSWLVDEMERSGHRPKLCNPQRGQAADGADQQDGQAGCERAGDPAVQRHSTGGVDSAKRAARPTRSI